MLDVQSKDKSYNILQLHRIRIRKLQPQNYNLVDQKYDIIHKL